jgi:murein DD-endopeptidase MepM/ murein hydrolase activator NlpD
MNHWRKWGALVLMPWIALSAPNVLFAANASQDIKQLQAEIQNKKAEVESISNKLEEYRSRISAYSKKADSLAGDVAVLENEQALAELDIVVTQTEIEAEQLEIQWLQERIADTDAELITQQASLKDVLFALHKQDVRGGPLEMVIGARDFGDVFRAASQLADMNADLQKALASTQDTRTTLTEQQKERGERLAILTNLEEELQGKVDALDTTKNAKIVLMSETRESENEYRALLGELRQEQQAVAARIGELQDNINERLASEDASSTGSTVFEHSGLDIAVAQGTAVEAAAPGIVAWAKTGRMYGNYVMIIHANGMATLYAHMSRLDVVQDQYVARGEVIGLSGGRAGSPGAGFSTGPHLHFEVREDGIPVDPFGYLP